MYIFFVLWNQSCRSSVLCLLGRIRDNMSGFELSTRSLNSLPKPWIRIPGLSQQWLTPAFVLLLMSTCQPRICSCAIQLGPLSWCLSSIGHGLSGLHRRVHLPPQLLSKVGDKIWSTVKGVGHQSWKIGRLRGTTGFRISFLDEPSMVNLWLIYDYNNGW